MWRRRRDRSLLLFLFELVERSISMTPYLVRSRLRKRFGLVAGARRDQREDKQTDDHSDPALLHAASLMIHSHCLPSGDGHGVIQMRGTDRRLSV
jgi:hypothetical protein